MQADTGLHREHQSHVEQQQPEGSRPRRLPQAVVVLQFGRAPRQGIDDAPRQRLRPRGHRFAVIAALAGEQARGLFGGATIPFGVNAQHMRGIRRGQRRDDH